MAEVDRQARGQVRRIDEIGLRRPRAAYRQLGAGLGAEGAPVQTISPERVLRTALSTFWSGAAGRSFMAAAMAASRLAASIVRLS